MNEERSIIDVVSENINRYMKLNNIQRRHLEQEVGGATIQNMLTKKTTNGCSILSLQKIAMALGVSTIDLVEDWTDEEWEKITKESGADVV